MRLRAFKMKLSTAKRRRVIWNLVLRTSHRHWDPALHVAETLPEPTSLMELCSCDDADQYRATLHACLLMKPRDLTPQILRDLSDKQTVVVLGTDRRPYAVALARWRNDTCFLDYICSAVKRCGRRLFHTLMHLAHARAVESLILNSIPELADMYVKWGCGCAKRIDDADAQTFTFNVCMYVLQTCNTFGGSSSYTVHKHGVHLYFV